MSKFIASRLVPHGPRGLLWRLPILSNLRELDSAPRTFLFFIVFNVVSWQCIAGPALVLFERKINMPPSLVGFTTSFMPLSMVLVIFTGRLVTHFGSKRVMFTAWMLRNLISTIAFLTPWAMYRWGEHAGWYVLMASTMGFCLMRAIGGGGWMPWLHEIVPDGQRAAYFSGESAVSQLLNVAISVVQAIILMGTPGVDRYLAIYGIGIISGLISLLWMVRVPGGRGSGGAISWCEDLAAFGKVFSDRPFLVFVLTGALCFSMMSWIGTASVMYMRDALGMPARQIMYITAACSVGVMFTVRFWGRYSEHSGNGASMSLSLAAHAAASLACLALAPRFEWSRYAIGPVMILASIFGSAFWTTTSRAMLSYLPATARVEYANVWTVITALAQGGTPILAGHVIEHMGLWGFRTCFLVTGIGGFACAIACRYGIRDTTPPAPPGPARMLLARPVLGALGVARITLGLHESNRARTR